MSAPNKKRFADGVRKANGHSHKGLWPVNHRDIQASFYYENQNDKQDDWVGKSFWVKDGIDPDYTRSTFERANACFQKIFKESVMGSKNIVVNLPFYPEMYDSPKAYYSDSYIPLSSHSVKVSTRDADRLAEALSAVFDKPIKHSIVHYQPETTNESPMPKKPIPVYCLSNISIEELCAMNDEQRAKAAAIAQEILGVRDRSKDHLYVAAKDEPKITR